MLRVGLAVVVVVVVAVAVVLRVAVAAASLFSLSFSLASLILPDFSRAPPSEMAQRFHHTLQRF